MWDRFDSILQLKTYIHDRGGRGRGRGRGRERERERERERGICHNNISTNVSMKLNLHPY